MDSEATDEPKQGHTGAQVHRRPPHLLFEKIVRERIFEHAYWKQHCFSVNAATLLDKAVELKAIGGLFGNQQPSHFLCLALRLLLINPEREILYAYIDQDDFKYIRALGAFLLRLVGEPVEIYTRLEPLLTDYRKLRVHSASGGYRLSHLDEFVDQLLTEDRACDTILPRMPKRELLEELGQLQERQILLAIDDYDEEDNSENNQDAPVESVLPPVSKEHKLRFKSNSSTIKSNSKSHDKNSEIEEANKLRASLGLPLLK
eukprot:Partr_v1_DN22824_c1_g1_i1_m77548 putative PRP38 pre-mRNA processing factor 38 (Yeast) domain containing A